ICLFCTVVSRADVLSTTVFYSNKTKVVAEQIELLKDRLTQAENQLAQLQRQQDKRIALSADHIDKRLLNQVKLDIIVANSNSDSINIELSESQQTISRLEKDNQALENQLNSFNVFGVKIARNGTPNVNNLQAELNYQKTLLQLEKIRSADLIKLQQISDSTLQLYKAQYLRVRQLLRSQAIMQLKERQVKSEITIQQKQSVWLQRLNQLYAELANTKDKNTYTKIENEIFYANEQVNFTYLQMLIARYQDQLQQFKVSVSRSSSITLLNKVSDQTQVLSKQCTRLQELLMMRVTILEKRKTFLEQEKIETTDLLNLENQYKASIETVSNLNRQLVTFRVPLNQALQQELASRQGLPGFGVEAWLDLGSELLLVPALTFEVTKNLAVTVVKSLYSKSVSGWLLLSVLEAAWVILFYFSSQFLTKRVSGMAEHESGHINLKWLGIKVLHRNLLDIAIIGNVYWLFSLCQIPAQHFDFLIDLALVWLFFKVIITVARLCLLETLHDRAGHDVRLYYRLKWVFLVGGVVTALTVFVHQLPVIFEVKDLFDRLFLLFLLVVSILLLKSWDVLPGLILPHIDERRTYFRRTVCLLGFLIPLIFLVNSVIGLFGFVNFVLTVSWYEGVFLCVLVGYLMVRGLLSDLMEFISHLLIRHVMNGWLWTEAFLKPVDKVLRIILFLFAWVVLFFLYGWNQQSPVVQQLIKILHYRIFDMLDTSITPMSIIELAVIISLLYWAARWTREFVYRFLLSRTKDLGVRNSIAILSQYLMILVGLFICLRVLGINFKALTIVASAFSLGIGLGLRDLANNFVCGFLLLIERPLRVGDIVSIDTYEGEVLHIGGRALTIRTWDHMEVLVPNAEIFSKSFVNWTAKDNIVRVIISIKINRHDSPHEVQALIYQVLAEHKDVLRDPAPEVFLKELAEGLVEFEVRYFINVRQVKSRIGMRSEVLMDIWEAFEKQGIQPPYPHHEIYVKGGPSTPLLPKDNL
ncbi:MAG TPA: mechanosensitive ion channel domain-containing protein, partial [Gammaproteobacteria bacterium]|nr:mechanosensitive ion channel domain-containing protein [Gammaproteobacteria bacterium]